MTNTPQAQTPWLVRPQPSAHARLRLFCFPYAGGGPLIYRTWPEYLPSGIEVCSIQLPGRGSQMHRSSLTRVSAIVEPLTQAIAGWPDKPFAFFGHSMGALLAFEVARKLRRERLRGPLGLFISARRAPQLEAEPMTYNLPEAEFMDELRRLNGTPREVLENAEMLQLMLPILRADFEVCQTYEYNYEPPLDCPIRAFGGTQDADVPAEHLEAWREQTTASFLLRMLHGDHFFIHTSQPLLLKMVASDLDRLMRDEK